MIVGWKVLCKTKVFYSERTKTAFCHTKRNFYVYMEIPILGGIFAGLEIKNRSFAYNSSIIYKGGHPYV